MWQMIQEGLRSYVAERSKPACQGEGRVFSILVP